MVTNRPIVSSARPSGSSHRLHPKNLISLVRSLQCLSADEDISGSQRIRNCSKRSSFVVMRFQKLGRLTRFDPLLTLDFSRGTAVLIQTIRVGYFTSTTAYGIPLSRSEEITNS